jgi:hypothetical protein
MVAPHDIDCHSVDIEDAFVRSELPEEIYICFNHLVIKMILDQFLARKSFGMD